MPPDDYNSTGYWESSRLRDFHDELLRSAGSSWHDVQLFPTAWYESAAGTEFFERAVSLVRAEYGDSSLFIVKDPRICRILPFWFRVLKAINVGPSFALTIRNPLEVAASLASRDGLPPGHSFLLWLRHTLEAERRTRGYGRTLLFYEDLLSKPGATVSRVAEQLHLDISPAFEQANKEIEAFVSGQRRHHAYSEDELDARQDVPAWLKRTYLLLRNGDGEETRAGLDVVWQELEAAEQAFSPVMSSVRSDSQVDSVTSRLQGTDDQREPRELQAALTAEIDRRVALTARIERLESNEERRTAIANELQREVQEARSTPRDQQEFEAVKQRLSEAANELQSARAELHERESAIDNLSNQAEAHQEEMAGRFDEITHLLGQSMLIREQFSARPQSWIQLTLGAAVGPLLGGDAEFDALFYVSRYPDVAESGLDPRWHYFVFGRKEGRRGAPESTSFSRYQELRIIAQSDLFDEAYYRRNNPDVVISGKDPLEHFVTTGAWEGRKPSEQFDPTYYMTTYLDVGPTNVNPLAHYLWIGRVSGRDPTPPRILSGKALARGDATGSDLAAEPEIHLSLGASDIKLIAFYLPQFHPIAENDRFWGKGFTEWTKTTQATPRFIGHNQPRHPAELGFYDLRLAEVQQRQIELAKTFGVYGFCYHYYWFDGKPVMNRPLAQILDNPDLDMPFCLHWANEPWTASWDGCEESGVLLDQKHSADDDISFLQGIERVLLDPRYISVDGRPLLAIYRPGLFSDIRATVDRWREHCLKAGIGELFLVATQQPFDGPVDPRQYGFDAAVEFPPHNFPVVDVRDGLEFVDADFNGFVASYDEVKRASLAKEPPGYKLFRGIMPGFDNTPRRNNGAGIYVGNTPEAYRGWLEALCRYSRANLPADERFIFVNAWNEWAEGAYLEPDRTNGYAFLNNTARAIRKFSVGSSRRKVVFIGHDAARAGAQMMLLHVIKWVSERTSTDVVLLLGKGGELLSRYEEIADVFVIEDQMSPGVESPERLREFVGEGVDLIYLNTVVAAKYLQFVDYLDAPVVTHVHELEKSIQRFADPEIVRSAVRRSAGFIAASPPVADNLVNNHEVDRDRIETVYSFIPGLENPGDHTRRRAMRAKLNLKPETVAVFGCGTIDWRKGPDIFVDVAKLVDKKRTTDFKFFWIGDKMPGEYEGLDENGVPRLLSEHVTFLGPKDSPLDYFEAGDIFLLSSREDPFPLVCLEAAQCGLPIVCFAEAGGMPDFVEDDAGFVVQHGDLAAMATAVAELVNNRGERELRGAAARKKLDKRHVADVAMPEIFHVMRTMAGSPPVVSVVIPSYNYDQYLEGRLDSVLGQTFQDLEVVVEDDCSTDQTMGILSRYQSRRNVKVEVHSKNLGVFSMWEDGCKAAAGSIIWIAEEDDLCELDFLEKMVPSFDDERVKLAYCQSSIIDEAGSVEGDYALCFPELSETKWLRPYLIPGGQEVKHGLGIKNFILNASGVLFRKADLTSAMPSIKDYRLSGDWALYLHLLRDGYIAYCPERLNYHRRHDASVIGHVKDTNLPISEAALIHSYVAEAYQVDEAFRKRMVDYAYQLWLERNPSAPSEEFGRIYPFGDPSAEGRGGDGSVVESSP